MSPGSSFPLGVSCRAPPPCRRLLRSGRTRLLSASKQPRVSMTCCSDTCVSAVFPSTPLAPRARMTDGLLLEQSGHRGRGRRPSKSPTGSCSHRPVGEARMSSDRNSACPAVGYCPSLRGGTVVSRSRDEETETKSLGGWPEVRRLGTGAVNSDTAPPGCLRGAPAPSSPRWGSPCHLSLPAARRVSLTSGFTLRHRVPAAGPHHRTPHF